MASQIKALEKLHREGVLNAGLLLVVGEESGSDGARIANFLKNDCRFLINGEPTENKMAIGTKGAIRFRLDTKGRTAHSAYPGQGESAILKMLDIFGRWRSASWPE